MSDRSELTLRERLAVFFINSALFYLAFILATQRGLPDGGLESSWLLAGVALWLLSLSAPWFTPPRDGLANAIAAGLMLVAFDLQPLTSFKSEMEILRWLSIAYCAFVGVISVVALVLYDRSPPSPTGRLFYRLNNIFGRGEILFTAPAAISIVGAFFPSPAIVAWLLLLWTFFVVVRPVERAWMAIQSWNVERTGNTVANVVGTILRIDHPDIVRVRLEDSSKWTPGTLHVVAMPHGNQRYALALFVQMQGNEVIGTGIFVATPQEPYVLPVGMVANSHDVEMAASFIEKMSGAPGSKLLGFTVEGSSIGTLRFEVAADTSIQEGDVVFAHIAGRDVFYQITDAETAEESFDQNPRGTHIVEAAQLGIYNPDKGFSKYQWLPAMNTPLFSASSKAFPAVVLGERDFVIGKVPSASISVAANIDDIIEFHTAVLGVTGTGKTELALELVREAVKRDAKVFCVDFTGEYRARLDDLKPSSPGPDNDAARKLEDMLFAVETGTYGAGEEKKKLKEGVEGLRGVAEKQIDEFLSAEGPGLGIFELGEITNTKATLRLTELYLSTIMRWAQAHRRARQIMIVLEEAHTIVPETAGSGFDFDSQWVVSRIGQIALQGRKYGVGLLVVTQRTALVSKTILSQCNTFFTHCLIDQTSLNFLENVYSSQHTRMIPNLKNLQFIAAGKAIRAERPILLARDFDPQKKEASDKLRKPLTGKAAEATPVDQGTPLAEVGVADL